ncbi:MAG: hemin uptake protein HemP [Pseudomonadota bacterium]
MSASAPVPTASAAAPAPSPIPAAAPLRSEQLLQGRRMVEIAHNGEVYRLQATRLGKLILTK